MIEVNNVTKEYKLGQLKSLKHTFSNALDRLRGREFEKINPFKALDDVSFKVEPGEVLGIIGQNGAGKSTLLKMLARISKPTRGEIKVHGTVAPLIEVGAGLIGDMTGRENIFLNGSILGLSQAEIRKKFDEIVSFAELEQFIETPIKRYSSGMTVRLGFAIATSVDADILIVDEVLAVGDLAFQRKCFDRMEEMIKRQGKTVLLVSHNIRQVERICKRVILMDHGKICKDGAANEVCNLFYARSDEQIKNNIISLNANKIGAERFETSGDIKLLSVSLYDNNKIAINKIQLYSDIVIVMKYHANITLKCPIFGLGVHTTDFLYLTTHHSNELKIKNIGCGEFEVICKINKFPLLPGTYSLRLGVAVGEFETMVFYAENVFQFQVIVGDEERTQSMREGFIDLNAKWKAEGLNVAGADGIESVSSENI